MLNWIRGRHSFNIFYIQIPTFDIYRIVLIVQSRYNVILENTSLFYDVCYKNARGCFEVSTTTLTHQATSTAETTQDTSKGSHNLGIIFGVVTIVAAGLVLTVFIVFRWKHKRRTPFSKERGKNDITCNGQKMLIFWKKKSKNEIPFCFLLFIFSFVTESVFKTKQNQKKNNERKKLLF